MGLRVTTRESCLLIFKYSWVTTHIIKKKRKQRIFNRENRKANYQTFFPYFYQSYFNKSKTCAIKYFLFCWFIVSHTFSHTWVILRLLSKHFWTGHPKFFLGGQMSFLYLVFTTFGQKNVFFCLLVGFFYIKKT